MIHTNTTWEKLGLIIKPNSKIQWMSKWTGASFAIKSKQKEIFDIYVTGRNNQNKSLIGIIKYNIKNLEVVDIDENPILDLGERGTFDENGTSYPWLIENKGELLMYYTGWVPTVITPFQNHVGLAKWNNSKRKFERESKAPILERTNNDPFGTGSVCVIKENKKWKMWYTCFDKWGVLKNEEKHYYKIKYAESNDGINWERNNKVCIDFKNNNEYCIAKPSVIKINNLYHMWYTFRGLEYMIGYALSKNGIDWERKDEIVRITTSKKGWDSKSICYPHVFKHEKKLYMLYCGNNYGEEGLGLAKLKI